MRRLAVPIAVVALALSGTAANAADSPFNGTVLSPARPAPALALRDQAGKLVRLSALHGKTVFVTFLYTHCPDVCPLIAARLNQVLLRLGAKRSGVRVLAVSIDPKGDTPASVRKFVRGHSLLPEFRYLTGTRAQLAPIWRAFHVAVLEGPKTIAGHSSYTLLIDARGRQRLLYDPRFTASQVLADLRRLASAPS